MSAATPGAPTTAALRTGKPRNASGAQARVAAAAENCQDPGRERGDQSTRESWRCFVAVRLGETITASLRTVAEDVRRGAEASGWRVAWTRPEGWHVTVKFLGDVECDRVSEVRAAIGRGIRGVAAFRIAALGLLVLPPAAQPRVLAVGLRDDGSLARLAAGLENELEPLGFTRETRRFTPHLTLGRVRLVPRPNRSPHDGSRQGSLRSAARSMLVVDWIERLRGQALGEDRIETVQMMRSNLSSGGSLYATMAVFALGAGGAGEASLL